MNKQNIKKRSSGDKVIAPHKTKTLKERSMNQIKYIGIISHQNRNAFY
jgi:hypothetical protein